MGLRIRVNARDGASVSNLNSTEELLDVMADAEMGMVLLTPDEEDTLRGWLLVRAEDMQPGQQIENHRGTNVALGKKPTGQIFLRDSRGEWPPQKPDMGTGFEKT